MPTVSKHATTNLMILEVLPLLLLRIFLHPCIIPVHEREGLPVKTAGKAKTKIALIGFMASGKSTIGKLLAKKIGYSFVDLDTLIEEYAGMSIPDIFSREGEEAFRRYESICLSRLKDGERVVIATGGGAPITRENRPFFTDEAYTFFLEVPLAEVLKRTEGSDNRPLLKMPKARIEELYRMRLPIYRSLGHPIQTVGKTPLEIADEIAAFISR